MMLTPHSFVTICARLSFGCFALSRLSQMKQIIFLLTLLILPLLVVERLGPSHCHFCLPNVQVCQMSCRRLLVS